MRRASRAKLAYVASLDQGITRQRRGKGFTYKTHRGKPLTSESVRQRIDALVIPPAWQDVVICSRSNGHLQVVGTDEAGRRQYIYHERWQAVSNADKFDRMHRFGELLPKIRRQLTKDLNSIGLSRRRVLAAVVRLLDKGHLRIGNRLYAKRNGAHGATTLLPDHVEVQRTRVRLDFPGKSGQQQVVELNDPKVAKVIRQCKALGGNFLFQYLDEYNEPHSISSSDVNESLQSLCGESITAKDFRTWWGSTLALAELLSISSDDSKTDRKRRIAAAIEVASQELGNTKAVCRSSYVHPGLITAAETGDLANLLSSLPVEPKRGLTIGERRFLAILPLLDDALTLSWFCE